MLQEGNNSPDYSLTIEEELTLVRYANKVNIPHKVLLKPFSEREKNLLQIMAVLISQYFALDELCKNLLKKGL